MEVYGEDGESGSISLLQKGNKRLQEELKKLNSLLTDFVELRRQAVKKQRSISNLPRPEVEIKKLDNTGKMLANAEDEYMRVTERINQVSDPQYLSLIHICRCRRYAVCRSRWSPYH
eukprot:TRINITY_DN2746_c0_g1_i1.p2 TRINITY_DN2746_c0_g1~~TRINITY_DN2746_c0_g1_i1.p2  ORF type:complete len:117 (+),score=48.10 TRINITY_DN2746_c0_g1_i1:568-918(+)